MRPLIGVVVLLSLSACSGDMLQSSLCGMRESACVQRCEPMRAEEAVACRRSCENSAKDKCG